MIQRGFLLVFALSASASAQGPLDQPPPAGDVDARAPLFAPPDVPALAEGGMRDAINRYRTDARTLQRFYDVDWSQVRRERMRELAQAWSDGLGALDFDALSQDDRIDYLLFANRLRYELRSLELEEEERAETIVAIPFGDDIADLQIGRRSLRPIDPEAAANQLVALKAAVEEARAGIEASLADGGEEPNESGESGLDLDRIVANRAAGAVRGLRGALDSWYRYAAGYDPLFTWWASEPQEELDQALEDYARYLRAEVAGVDEDDTDTIVGDPIGRAALLTELEREWIPYTPEELMEIAEAEFAWCDREMALASNALGFGDDWRAAQEHVKTLHVGPGEQPELIRMLAFEAVDFLEERELLTIPPLAKNSWRMEMMSPERQQYTPYFTGGEVISVSFPTDSMAHADKLMSMRGNNVHFSRATVHHELIPGHHLQQFMNARHKTWRRAFGTPFWGEGWALYWEMLLWDEGFPQSPEDKIGMLFWRKHRCARILFSLAFQLGEWTPEECIDFLVERVGHEVKNATAEVRRSVQGGYGPLYQAAYMLGGLQFRALHRELVQSGQRTNRAFHDAILRENSIPVELVRAKLTNQELTRDTRSSWRFYD